MAKQVITPTYLSREELSNLARVTKDVFFFSQFVYVINPIHGKVQFNLYPYQKSVLYNFTRERFNIILKFRQAGITELISLYCLWLTMFHPNKKVNIISINDRTSKKVLRKIKFMYKNLPWYMQTPIINGRAGEFGSASLIEFDNGSFIESIPTSPEAGRSESLTLLVIDEAAMVRWAGEVMSAALPTLSCVTGNTKLLIKKELPKFKKSSKTSYEVRVTKIRHLCPSEKGVMDISNCGYYTLTHKGNWKKILYSQNKGELVTWKVRDERGKILRATPKHRLFTTLGWKTLEEIIENNLWVIQVDTKIDTLRDTPITTKPEKEILKPLRDFPNYYVSNLGNVYCDYERKGWTLVPGRYNKDGYLRVCLKKPGIKRDSGRRSKSFQRCIHQLVAEAFLGPKPEGMQIDHIDCVMDHNWISNLRYIRPNRNVSRSYEYNFGSVLNSISSPRLPDLAIRGKILEMAREGFSYHEIGLEVYPQHKQGKKFVKRILTERGSRVYVTKLTKLREYTTRIYDIHVEGDESYITASNYVNHNTGGSAILNSTPKGIGGFYHSTWVDSIAGSNGFNPLRLYWRMHPERDDHWYDTMSRALGPRRTAQEIDGDFLGSGNTVFDLGDIKAIEDCLSDYPVIKKKFNGQYRQYLEPDPNKEYFIGADVATGRNTDYSSFTCMDKPGEEQVVYKGRMAPDKFARLLGDTGQLFNYATIAPESNDVGLAVTSMLQTEGYPKLYYYQKLIRKKGQSRPETDKAPGWLTTNKNRSVIIEGLEQDIREENIIVKDPFFVQEAYTFIYDGMGRPVAMGKHKTNTESTGDDDEVYADDDIFGKAICNHIRKGKANIIVQPR